MYIYRITMLACALLLAACDNPSASAPDTPEGDYSLVTAEGGALPAWIRWDSEVDTPEFQIVGGAVSLGPPDQLQVIVRTRSKDIEGRLTPERSDTLSGTYTREGTDLTLRVNRSTGSFWMLPEATLHENQRIDAVLEVLLPAYNGYLRRPVEMRFTR